jgi:hypothetical protein
MPGKKAKKQETFCDEDKYEKYLKETPQNKK